MHSAVHYGVDKKVMRVNNTREFIEDMNGINHKVRIDLS